ncbi:hypothetical protein ACQP1S_02400 [Micromonospora matsumotoense]|uniref:hypothetical protein n=1 Tax=Micromonospora matsumotoense TaxID=121616 RepID=UPI003D8E576F
MKNDRWLAIWPKPPPELVQPSAAVPEMSAAVRSVVTQLVNSSNRDSEFGKQFCGRDHLHPTANCPIAELLVVGHERASFEDGSRREQRVSCVIDVAGLHRFEHVRIVHRPAPTHARVVNGGSAGRDESAEAHHHQEEVLSAVDVWDLCQLVNVYVRKYQLVRTVGYCLFGGLVCVWDVGERVDGI